MSRAAKALLLSPAVILIASGTRLIVISNHDTTTAVTIASSGGVAGTLLGTVVPLLPAYLPLVVLLLVLFRKPVFAVLVALATTLVSPAYVGFNEGWRRAMNELGALLGHLYHFEFGTLWNDHRAALICIAVGVVFAGWGTAQVRLYTDEFLAPSVKLAIHFSWGLVYATVCLVGLLFVQAVYRVPFDFENFDAIMRRPWVPAEEITLDTGERYVGYTITTKDGWFLLLNEHDRSLDYLDAASVVSRRVCTPAAMSPDYRDPLHRLDGSLPPINSLCRERTRPAAPPPAKLPPDGGPARALGA
jgi:hypothetical protein